MFETVAEREGFSRCEKRDARTCWQEGSSMVCCTRRAWKGKSRVQHPAVKRLDLIERLDWTKWTNAWIPGFAAPEHEPLSTTDPCGCSLPVCESWFVGQALVP